MRVQDDLTKSKIEIEIELIKVCEFISLDLSNFDDVISVILQTFGKNRLDDVKNGLKSIYIGEVEPLYRFNGQYIMISIRNYINKKYKSKIDI